MFWLVLISHCRAVLSCRFVMFPVRMLWSQSLTAPSWVFFPTSGTQEVYSTTKWTLRCITTLHCTWVKVRSQKADSGHLVCLTLHVFKGSPSHLVLHVHKDKTLIRHIKKEAANGELSLLLVCNMAHAPKTLESARLVEEAQTELTPSRWHHRGYFLRPDEAPPKPLLCSQAE